MNDVTRYADMKDSGVEWLGQIPRQWGIKKLKYLVSHIESGVSVNAGQSEAKSDEYGVLKTSCVSRFAFDVHQNKSVNSDEIERLSCPVCKNTIIVSRMNTPDLVGACGYVNESNDRIFLPDRLWQVHFTNQNIVKYVFYFLSSSVARNYYASLSTGTSNSMQNISQGQFLNFTIAIPEYCEITKIVSYLDDQCAKIDDIIAGARTSIEEYKKWKASVIYEAVTKGLDPHVEMKDSGVEWIGKIPKHWKVCKFGMIASVKSNLVSPLLYPNLYQVSPENIEKGSGKILPCKTVEESGVISLNHLFYSGQILYSKVRPQLNKVTIAPFNGLCSADMYPIETSQCYKFVMYMMLSEYFLAQVSMVTENRVKMPKLNQNELSQIMVCVPSQREQENIVSYLDTKCSEIDQLISEKEALIADLESYKKSLIYEVVTGKRNVS